MLKYSKKIFAIALATMFLATPLMYNVPIVMDSLVGSIESDMGIKAT